VSNLQGKKILIIDDEPDLLVILEYTFSQAGAHPLTAANGHDGLRQFYAHQPDLAVVDLMMPGMSGWEVCRNIRQVSETPIIILTALDTDKEVIRGLDFGADDFVTKPISPEVLLARARATLRRAELPSTTQQAASYNDGYLLIDLNARLVYVDGLKVNLSATEYRLLSYLLRYAGRVLTFEQILEKVWGAEYRDNIDYVHVYMSRLRRKLEKDPKQPTYLLTEHGVGYRFAKHEARF
jgi:two-component system KDP operon response regulator KdpE